MITNINLKVTALFAIVLLSVLYVIDRARARGRKWIITN